ncbi:DsbA family oxidoreductase [Nonomuraea sp. NPDC049141]|uniref:DsbA family oxidoreductase n=1 Tax=Nonomuraea sp. NPDC049141 TaxID=3155500 RepID=UPI0033F7A17E
MKVEVYGDIACPWCRLGTHQFHRAVAAAGAEPDVELVHRPYQLIPDAPEEPRPLVDTVAEMFGPEQAESMLAEMTRLGASEGIEYRFDRAMAVNTLTAHRLLWLALDEYGAGVQAALATALYDAYFRDGVNVADHLQLTELAERVGLVGDRVRNFLASAEGVVEVREHVAAARREGVTTVPRFVFENGALIVGVTSTEALRDALRKASTVGADPAQESRDQTR